MKPKKTKLLVLWLLSVIFLFSGLGAVGAAEPKFGGILRVMADADISSLDPHKIGWQNHEVLRQIFEGLLAVDEGFKVIPGLGKSWTVSDDGLIYTFHLRKGVLFHNGKELKAADIKATYERLLQSSIKQKFETISKIETPDDYTVVMTLSKPTATFLINVAQPHTIGIMPAEEAAAEENQKNIQNPIGTGPFMFVEWIPDRHVRLKRFEKYWGGDGEPSGSGGKKVAYVDEVIIRPIKERSVRVSSLEAGDIDLGFIPTTQKSRLEENKNLKIMGTGPTFDFWNFWFCVNEASPMKNLNLRKAFAYAIDKQEMIIATTGGPGSVANSAFPTFSSWYSEFHSNDYGPKRDVEKHENI
jgi:peptide/nickel transport system substrate-binding protein